MRKLISNLTAALALASAAAAFSAQPAAAQQFIRSLSGYTCTGPIHRASTVRVRFAFYPDQSATIQTDMDGFAEIYGGWTWSQDGARIWIRHQDGSVLSGALQGATIQGFYDHVGDDHDYDGPTTLTCVRS